MFLDWAANLVRVGFESLIVPPNFCGDCMLEWYEKYNEKYNEFKSVQTDIKYKFDSVFTERALDAEKAFGAFIFYGDSMLD